MVGKRRLQRRLAKGGAIGAAIVGGSILVSQIRNYLSSDRPVDKATFLGVILAVIALELPIFAYLRKSRELEAVRASLRDAVTRDLRDRLRQVRLSDEHIELRLTSMRSGKTMSLTSFITQQVAEADARPAIVGDAGSGKSYTTLALAYKLLTSGDKIPIVVPLSHWQDGDSVVRLISNHLVSAYAVSVTTANELVTTGRLVPIFDGLDEIDIADAVLATATHFLDALRRWNTEYFGTRFVLTCQAELWTRIERGSRTHAPVTAWYIDDIDDLAAETFVRACLTLPIDSPKPRELLDQVAELGLTSALTRADSLSMLGKVFRQRFRDGESPGQGGPNAVDGRIDQEIVARIGQNGLIAEYVTSSLRSQGTTFRRIQTALAVAQIHRYAVYLDRNRAGTEIADRLLEDRDIRLHRLWPICGVRAPRVVDFAIAALLSAPGLAWMIYFLYPKGAWALIAGIVFVCFWSGLLLRTTFKPWVRPAVLELSRLRRPRAAIKQLVVSLVVAGIAYPLVDWQFAIIAAVTSWLAIGLTVGFGQTLTTDVRVRELGPSGVLSREHFISRVSAYSVGPALCYGLSKSFGIHIGIAAGVIYALIVGETVASALWRRYLAVCLITLPGAWITPTSVMRNCHRLGFLRVNGTDYRFRSDAVQQYFTDNARSIRQVWKEFGHDAEHRLGKIP